MRRRFETILRVAVHLGAFLPLLFLLWRFGFHELGANPIREAQLRLGFAAISLLLASLACTPLQIFTGYNQVLSWRGFLGRYALMYALLHFFNYIAVDYGFNFTFIRGDLFEKRYALVGLAAFVVLLAVGVMSLKRPNIKWLRSWNGLRWLVYLAAVLAVTHYIWQSKLDMRLPFIYAGVLFFLFLVRLPPIKRFIVFLRAAL
jgi:methionine sulfoxide reductase heme-binding subunit